MRSKRNSKSFEKSSRETRLSLETIEKNKQSRRLRAKLTKRLAEPDRRRAGKQLDARSSKPAQID